MARTVASVLALGLVALTGARLSGDTIMRSRCTTIVSSPWWTRSCNRGPSPSFPAATS